MANVYTVVKLYGFVVLDTNDYVKSKRVYDMRSGSRFSFEVWFLKTYSGFLVRGFCDAFGVRQFLLFIISLLGS